jgi:hypothetical protein
MAGHARRQARVEPGPGDHMKTGFRGVKARKPITRHERTDDGLDEQRSLLSEVASCPSGHALPNHTDTGQCTPLYCAGSQTSSNKKLQMVGTKKLNDKKMLKRSLKDQLHAEFTPVGGSKAKKQVALLKGARKAVKDAVAELKVKKQLKGAEDIDDEMAQAVAKAEYLDGLHTVGAALGRYLARKKLYKYPEFTDEKEAIAYVEKKLVTLAPEALAQLEYELKMGDSNSRAAAAREVLDRAGFAKSDKSDRLSQPIVLINAGANGVQVQSGTAPWLNRVNAVPTDGEKK